MPANIFRAFQLENDNLNENNACCGVAVGKPALQFERIRS
jgi:hypothetical protein